MKANAFYHVSRRLARLGAVFTVLPLVLSNHALFAGTPVSVYSTLSEPGDTFCKPAGDVLNFNSYGVAFTNTTAGALDGLKLCLSEGRGTGSEFLISLRTDSINENGQHVPSDTTLEMWAKIGAATIGSPDLAASVFLSVSQPQLSPGTVYWVVVALEDPAPRSVQGVWNFNSEGVSGQIAQATVNGNGKPQPWVLSTSPTTLPGVQVLVAPVPEPSSALFLVGGLVALAVLRRATSRHQ